MSYAPELVQLDELMRAVTAAGYTATPRDPQGQPDRPRADVESTSDETDDATQGRDRELAALKRKWQVALTTGLGLMVLMYVPLHVDTMDWLMPAIFVVATVVQFWAGRGIYAAAWAAPATAQPT